MRTITWEQNGPFALCLYNDSRCGRSIRDIIGAITTNVNKAAITEAFSFKVVSVFSGRVPGVLSLITKGYKRVEYGLN